MYGSEVKLDGDSTWLCNHATSSGTPAPSTRLSLDQTVELVPGHRTGRRWINCPDCGTFWRVWPDQGVAKPAAEWNPTNATFFVGRYRRAPVLDIDRIIDRVKLALPEIAVMQHHNIWPADDEGVWWFQLPNVEKNIQIESSTGTCPFFVEHDGMPSPADGGGWNAASVEEAGQMIVDYLREQAMPGGTAAG